MGIGTIVTLLGPALTKLVEALVDRFWNHGVSTLQGTAGGAAVLALLQSWGCHLDAMQQSVLAGIPLAIGALSTDANKSSTSIWDKVRSVFLDPKVVTATSDSKQSTP